MLTAQPSDHAAAIASAHVTGLEPGSDAHFLPGLVAATAGQRSPARVMVIAAEASTCAHWESSIRGQSDLVCVATATDDAEGRARLLAEPADLVVMALRTPAHDSFEAIAALRRQRPQALVILLTDAIDAGLAQRAMAAGASGFLATAVGEAERLAFLRKVLATGPWTPPTLADAGLHVTARSAAPIPGGELTQREQDVLDAMARGLSNQAVAKELGITVPTVKFHVTNILGKLKVDNRTEAVLFALRHGLVDLS